MNPEDLKQQLAELEKNLKAATTAEAKAELEKQKKELEQKLTDATKDVPEIRKELNVTKEALTKAEESIKVMKDAADKNQAALDKLIAEGNHKPVKDSDKSFNSLLKEAITEKAADIQATIKERKVGQRVLVDLKAAGDMSFSANASTLDQAITTLRPGIITLPRRRLHVRELVPGGTMANSTFTFLREKTTGEGNPAAVTEANWKEQFDIDLEEVDSPTQYIAGYLVCSTKMFDDIPGFVSFLQNRLLEKLLRSEDVQILSGSGVAPNLSGITTSGNFTAPTSAATIDEVQLIDSIAQLEMLDRDANGILVSPQDYYRLYTYTAAGSGEFTNSRLSTIVGGQLYIGGVPVFRSTALATDKFITGDWTNGINLITREAPRVEIFYEDAYNVRRNQVTVRVEERVALPIYGADYFIYGDLGNS